METRKFAHMWKSINIGNVTIKNRFYMAPVGNGLVDRGRISQQFMSFYARRARGGVGLVIVSPGIHLTGKSAIYIPLAQLADSGDKYMWNELAETIHAFDCKVFVQAQAGSLGRQVPRGVPSQAPSPIPLRIPPEMYPEKEEEFRFANGVASR